MPRQKWCTVCCKATHNTADCWGLGTVSLPEVEVMAYFPPNVLQVPFEFKLKPNWFVLLASDKSTGCK